MKTSKFLLSAICLLLGYSSIKAQICNTPAPPPPDWFFNRSLRSSQTTRASYTMSVYIHIVRSSSGSGLGSGVVSSMISKLNSDYAGTGIQFQSAGSGFINIGHL